MIDITDKNIDRQLFVGQYQFVDVEFGPSHQDLVIRYDTKRIRSEDLNKVRWFDVTPGCDVEGATYDPSVIYRPTTNATPFGPGYVVLRCNIANYSTRLLLFTERNEASNG